MKKQIPLTAVLAIGLVILLAAFYFAVLGPKRSEASRLETEIADLEATVSQQARAASTPDQPKVQIDVADLFRLAKAMPDNEDMPGIILELNSMASSAGVRFLSIQPQVAVTRGPYSAMPINLTFEGNYYDLTDFLYRLRSLVTVKDGVLDAAGRLYTLDALDLHEAPEQEFPKIEAILTISAYSFGAPPPAPGAAVPPPATTTTGTTTTNSTTTTDDPPADPSGDGDSEAAG